MKASILILAVIALTGCDVPKAPVPNAAGGTTLWHEEYAGAAPTHRAVFDHPQDCRRFVNAMQALEPQTRWFCK